MIWKKHFTAPAAAFAAVLLLTTLSGCGGNDTAKKPAEPAASLAPAGTSEPVGPPEAGAGTQRRDGERFETVVLLEGMEETIRYEHVRNETAGFELDYDYELLERRGEPNGEWFVSRYDVPEDPENYLKVTYNARDAEPLSAAVGAALSNDFNAVVTEPYTLGRAGGCVRISASDAKGGGARPGTLRTVYVIPAADGCRVATVQCTVESAEGFGARFSDIVHTLSVLDSRGDIRISDEQAVSAVKRYCLIRYPDLEDIVNAGEYPVYWDVSSSDEKEVVVLFRSYTGALVRYYVDRVTGEAYATEFVPGITPGEVRTDESLNAWDTLA